MKVRMKVAISGTRNGASWPSIGGTIDVPDGEGKTLCASGMADPVAEPDPPVETATPQRPVETRDEPPKKRGRPAKPRDADGNIIRD